MMQIIHIKKDSNAFWDFQIAVGNLLITCSVSGAESIQMEMKCAHCLQTS